MKKLFVWLGIAVAMGCTSRSINPGYKIIGNIQGLNNNNAILYRFVNEDWVAVDTARAEKGAFMFLGRVEIPEIFKVSISDSLPAISIFVENDEINLVGHIDSMRRYRIAGSKSHEEYERFWGKQEVFSTQMDKLERELRTARSKNDRKKQADIENRMNEVWKKEIESIRNYVLENKSSVVSAYLAWSRLASNSTVNQLETIAANFDSTLNKSLYISMLNDYITKLKRVEPGQEAINFSMYDSQGEILQLSSLYGKYLLIDFWASWCTPCKAEKSWHIKAYEKYSSKGFDIVSVSLDKNRDKWMDAIKDYNLTWHHVSDLNGWGNAASRLYGIRSIPSNILLDPDGVIIAKNLRGEEIEKKLNEIINQKNLAVNR